jgi:excisionase family DNA binding protein
VSEAANGGNDMTELLTAVETARLLRCSLRTLDRERAEGRGCPFVRIGGRVRYRKADVEAFVAAHVRGHATGAVPSPDMSQPRRRRLSKHVAHGGAV